MLSGCTDRILGSHYLFFDILRDQNGRSEFHGLTISLGFVFAPEIGLQCLSDFREIPAAIDSRWQFKSLKQAARFFEFRGARFEPRMKLGEEKVLAPFVDEGIKRAGVTFAEGAQGVGIEFSIAGC